MGLPPDILVRYHILEAYGALPAVYENAYSTLAPATETVAPRDDRRKAKVTNVATAVWFHGPTYSLGPVLAGHKGEAKEVPLEVPEVLARLADNS